MFALDGVQILNGELMLVAPVDEGGFGDAEFPGDAVEAPALDPKLDEAVDGTLIVHNMNQPCEDNRQPVPAANTAS